MDFCLWLKKEYKIDSNNIICVGDEFDIYFGSLHKKDPSVNFSAAQEILECKKKIKVWVRHFPKMRLAVSNHGTRWLRKAVEAELPSQVIKSLGEIYDTPKEWVWKHEWLIKTKHPWRVLHGCGYSGYAGARNAALDAQISTAIGHLHSFGGVAWVNQNGSGRAKWGMNTGCLIDEQAFAFEYGKHMRSKPTVGAGVVVNDGSTPIFVPIEAMP